MVDLNEALDAIDKTPQNQIKKKSFVEKTFLDTNGLLKPIKVTKYEPGMQFSPTEITIARNFRVKLKNNYVLEQDFVVIPAKSGMIYLPITELSTFCAGLNQVLNTIGKYNEK